MSRDSCSADSERESSCSADEVALSWNRRDIERKLGFRGGRYTRVNNLLSFLLGLVLTIAYYACLLPFRGSYVSDVFTERGPTPYFISLFSFWSLAILFLKSQKLSLQRAALQYDVVPSEHDFVLSATTVGQIVDRIYATVDEPRQFVLFNRIIVALANLENLGRVSDIDDILRSQAENEESSIETSYSLLKGFVWAIPVLGFIGTVLGLSQAVGGFGAVLASVDEMSVIASSLQTVTAGLATAFDTTLVALVFAVAIQLLVTFLRKAEEEFLDECSEYCSRRVVGRLRLMPFEEEQE